MSNAKWEGRKSASLLQDKIFYFYKGFTSLLCTHTNIHTYTRAYVLLRNLWSWYSCAWLITAIPTQQSVLQIVGSVQQENTRSAPQKLLRNGSLNTTYCPRCWPSLQTLHIPIWLSITIHKQTSCTHWACARRHSTPQEVPSRSAVCDSIKEAHTILHR